MKGKILTNFGFGKSAPAWGYAGHQKENGKGGLG
ncbi:hypothetical protein E2C01_074650 [Portunus trituberculatus]|uniref:Uncharacterized protein n=1 Tax=Portunus trituberculatus TaxID=210409 RepID=A0A5B7ICT3_PORTR|nr:hypothetical protein [Portunus trituberculatus]